MTDDGPAFLSKDRFAYRLWQAKRRQIERWQEEVGLNVPVHLLDECAEWRERWLHVSGITLPPTRTPRSEEARAQGMERILEQTAEMGRKERERRERLGLYSHLRKYT